MAHELDIRANGIAAMFSVRETPWHRLGTVLTEAPTLREALEVGGLDFDVDLRPLYTRFPIPGLSELSEAFTYEAVPGAFTTVRTDRQEVLGVVGQRYTPLQNRDAFAVLQPLLDDGVASIETGGVIKGGRQVWLQVAFKLADERVAAWKEEQGLKPYGFISTAHDGSRAVRVQESDVRIVRRNTLYMALGGLGHSVRVPHRAGVEQKVKEAAMQLWGSIGTRHRVMMEQFQALQVLKLDPITEFPKIVLDTVAPIPAELSAKRLHSRLTGHEAGSLERIQARRLDVTRLWRDGAGHTGDGSAWEALQGAVESIDHNEKLWRAGDRLDSLMNGRLASLKLSLTDVLVGTAQERGLYTPATN